MQQFLEKKMAGALITRGVSGMCRKMQQVSYIATAWAV